MNLRFDRIKLNNKTKGAKDEKDTNGFNACWNFIRTAYS